MVQLKNAGFAGGFIRVCLRVYGRGHLEYVEKVKPESVPMQRPVCLNGCLKPGLSGTLNKLSGLPVGPPEFKRKTSFKEKNNEIHLLERIGARYGI